MRKGVCIVEFRKGCCSKLGESDLVGSAGGRCGGRAEPKIGVHEWKITQVTSLAK